MKTGEMKRRLQLPFCHICMTYIKDYMLQEHNIMKVSLWVDVSASSNKQLAKSSIHAVHSD